MLISSSFIYCYYSVNVIRSESDEQSPEMIVLEIKTKQRSSYRLRACEYSPPGDSMRVDLLLLFVSSVFRPRSQDSFRKLGSPVSQLLIITILSKHFLFSLKYVLRLFWQYFSLLFLITVFLSCGC